MWTGPVVLKKLILRVADAAGYQIVKLGEQSDRFHANETPVGVPPQPSPEPPKQKMDSPPPVRSVKQQKPMGKISTLPDIPAETAYSEGLKARKSGDDELAFKYFARAVSLLPRY